MRRTEILLLILSICLVPHAVAQAPPVVPLTNALTAVYCHNLNDVGTMTIRCGANEKIRMLDAFDVVVLNRSHLPLQCLKRKPFAVVYGDISNDADCKVHTSFSSACSGRENCTLHMQRTRLNSVKEQCHNELVDYTMAFFECISDVFIHDICSTQAITSPWGTLKTPNFPNPYTSHEDCWCKLSTQLQHRLLLSVVTFQLIPYDQQCAGAGLYLQSSDQQRSTQCTYLQPGHNYLSDTNSLYINFYSRTSTVRGGFWIIYEASHSDAEVHLRCGPREKIGPSLTPVPLSSSPPPVSSPYNHGWSRLSYNDPPNPTTLPDVNQRRMDTRFFVTTPNPLRENSWKMNVTTTPAGAFTYPHGRLTTFNLEFGPRGWFVRYSYGSSNMTATKFLQAVTTPSPVVKWNSTWLYIRRLRTRIPPTIIRDIVTTTATPSTTTATTTPPTETTTLELTTEMIPTSTLILTTTEQIMTTALPSSTIGASLSTQQNDVAYDSFITSAPLEDTTKITSRSATGLPPSSSTSKTTVPFPTPWYPPAGPFDWWQWQRLVTKSAKTSSTTPPTTQTTTETTAKTTTSTITSTATTTTTAATTTTTTATTTTITTMVTASSTRKSIITISNTTRKETVAPKTETTVDWFRWPHKEAVPTTKEKPEYYDEEYLDWFDHLPTKKPAATSTVAPVLLAPQRKQYQQMSLLPTQSHSNVMDTDRSAMIPALSRTPLSQQITEETTYTNAQNSIQEPQKKESDDEAWFSRTDMTIVAISILFVILLVFINLILFAVRRHRHRIQNQHLLCASLPSSLNDRTLSNNQLHSSRLGDSTNSLINITNNNNSDILPAVGEIVLWDEKDQGGYMIDNHGEWAKIEGRQWLGSSALKNQTKTSFSKSFRSRFQFIRQSNKKSTFRHPPAPSTPKLQQHQHQQQQTSKFPLLMDSVTLSPVPEADDYQSSDFSSTDIINRNSHTKLRDSHKKHQLTTKTIQALIHDEQDHSDDYYRRIESVGDDSNYTTMPEHHAGEYSIAEQQPNRSLGNEIDAEGSVFISVPTMLRQEDDIGIMTDTGESVYNQRCATRPVNEANNLHTKSAKACKQLINHSMIVGHCQANIQPLNPRLLEKSLLAEHQQLYTCSQSLQFSAYDSGFFEDQTTDSLVLTSKNDPTPSDETVSNDSSESSLRGNCQFAKTYC